MRRCFQQLFRRFHHPEVILVSDIKLQNSKLRIVRPVHALVAEIAAEFVHPFKATNDQALQV